MTEINLHNEYSSSGESIRDLFDRTEEGFFVPLYQREYTWEEENINQLFDDLVMGVRELSEENEKATTFLGTTILTTLSDKKQTVKVGEERAQPTSVQIVIDGQQRISTLSLMSIQIIVKLRYLLEMLPNKNSYSDLHNVGNEVIKRIKRLHAIELGKGANPPQKPKIIRGRDDQWTYDGDDTAYGSPVAHYIATFIRTSNSDKAIRAINNDNGSRVRGNIKLIDQWLDAICDAHIPGTKIYGQFPVGAKIISLQMQEYVLGFTDDSVKLIIEKSETDKNRNDYYAAAIYQIILLTYYLLRRCGINRLQPTREEWGFDMFQALNATGTPLTVMETFLPTVMQAEYTAGKNWTSTPSYEMMSEIQELFDATTTNERKNQRTNELLRTFALCYDGQKLSNKFSAQRRWITQIYEKQLSEIDEKREFIRKLSRTANFFYCGWYMEDRLPPYHISGLDKHPEGGLASLLVRYLKDAGSKLSAPVLTRFYSQLVDSEENSNEFVECAKACAAFFTIWRSAKSTSGLDDVYRRYFKGGSTSLAANEYNWENHPKPLQLKDLKKYFLDILKSQNIAERDAWITASNNLLLYTELKTVCRFILFIAGHNRVPDEANPGLTCRGTNDSCTLLNLEKWMAKDHKTLEHIAPQSPPSEHNWDSEIYERNLEHHIGNLMLLPVDVNKFAGNKNWNVKYLYYCHVGERSKEKINKLEGEAKSEGIVLDKKAINVLSNAKYNCAVEPILKVGKSGTWDATLIEKRTQEIKEIAWKKLISWLDS